MLGSSVREPNRRFLSQSSTTHSQAIVDTVLERDTKAAIVPMALWDELCSNIRSFNPDYVVLVARKMPRLFDAIPLDLGSSAVCISDQAVPFVRAQLENARVAIVDDLWNVGSTMLHAKARVELAKPRAVGMFALGAKDAVAAVEKGVSLAEPASMSEARYEHFVSTVPNLLRLVPKPYDADFPIARCALQAPFRTWEQCWAWLQLTFGSAAHTTIDDGQRQKSLARATVNLRNDHGWALKARLYFDFTSGTCNVVPMALAPSLPLEDVYPEGSLAKQAFKVASVALGDLAAMPDEDRREAFGRLGAFCDSLVFLEDAVQALAGLVRRDSIEPFSIKDFAMQFGPAAAVQMRKVDAGKAAPLSPEAQESFLLARKRPEPQALIESSKVVCTASQRAQEGWPAELVFDALFQGLAKASGADDPSQYSLERPYTSAEIQERPYLRLRIGFTYGELIEFLRTNLRTQRGSHAPEAVTSALIDWFVDLGAIVPTITFRGDPCLRVYRKGESNPRWDTDLSRLVLALKELRGSSVSRTRVSKVAAILAMSSVGDTSGIRVAPAERGTVAVMGKSVVERSDIEVTAYLRNAGLWDKLVSDAGE